MNKRIKLIILFFSNLISCLSVSFFSSFLNSTNINYAANQIVNYSASYTTTNSVNINLNYLNNEFSLNDLKSKTMENYNLNKRLFNNKYVCRTIFDEQNNAYFYNEFEEHFNSLLFSTSGTHKNNKGENINDWHELKMAFDREPSLQWEKIDTFINIREETAKKIFNRNSQFYSLDNAKCLIEEGWFLNFSFNNNKSIEIVRVQINNIILDNKMDQYFSKLYGNYFTMYANGLKNCQNVSTNIDLGPSERYNAKWLKYIKKALNDSNTSVAINSRNVTSKQHFENLNFLISNYLYSKTSSFDFLFYIIIILIVLIMLFFEILTCDNLFVFLSIFSSFTLSYLLIKYVFTLYRQLLFNKIFVGVCIVNLLIVFVLYMIKKYILLNKYCINI